METKEDLSVAMQLIQAFSAIRNARKLISVDSKPNEFSALDGMKFFSLLWVVLGHTCQLLLYTPIGNQHPVEFVSKPNDSESKRCD